jgi:hypothetical protein
MKLMDHYARTDSPWASEPMAAFDESFTNLVSAKDQLETGDLPRLKN